MGVARLSLLELLLGLDFLVHFNELFMEIFLVLSLLIEFPQLLLSLVVLHLQKQVPLLLQSLPSLLQALSGRLLGLLPFDGFLIGLPLLPQHVLQTFALILILLSRPGILKLVLLPFIHL